MSEEAGPEWLRLCREEGLEPGEVRLVLGRYKAYREYYLQARRQPLPLEGWFECYRIETASDATAASPAANGCSVDGDSQNRGAIARPAAFLRALASLAAATEGL